MCIKRYGNLTAPRGGVLNPTANKKHDPLSTIISDVALLLLSAEYDQFNAAMNKCLNNLAAAVNAMRMRIWKNLYVNGELHCACMYEWSAQRLIQHKDKPVELSYQKVLQDWDKILAAGHSVKRFIREMPLALQKQFGVQGMRSILALPLLIEEDFWGFVEFNDCDAEHEFSTEGENILRLASQLIIKAMLRNQVIENIMKAREDALYINKAKSNYLSNMSSEIRTPINAIIGMTALGKSASGSERKDYAFAKIEDASGYLLALINDILDMSKIESNQFELTPAEFDFKKLIKNTTEIINAKIKDKNQNFAFAIDKHLPQLLIGDGQRLSQVIINLLSNAINSTPKNGEIKLNTKLIRTEGDEFIISIEIMGTGVLNRIQQDKYKNSIVFIISEKIIELMQGRLSIESDQNKGAKFSFNARFKKGGTKVPGVINDGLKLKNIFTGKKLLIVDDIDINREIIFSMLEDSGIEIQYAGNGREGIRMYTEAPESFDVILMDIQMPEMDGYEAARWIRACEQEWQKKPVPIIALTAHVFHDEVNKCMESGMNDHVGKPVDPDELIQKLKQVL